MEIMATIEIWATMILIAALEHMATMENMAKMEIMETMEIMEMMSTISKIKFKGSSMEAATPVTPCKISLLQSVKSLEQKSTKLCCKMCHQPKGGVEQGYWWTHQLLTFEMLQSCVIKGCQSCLTLEFQSGPPPPPVQPSDSPSFVSPQYAEWGEREEDADRSKLKRTTLLPRKFPPNSRPKSISFPDDKLHELPKNTRCQKNTKRTPREYPKNIRRMSEEYPKKAKECPKNTQRTPQKLNFTPGFIRNVIQIQTRKKEMKDFTFFESHFDEMSLWLHM